ncbi:sodium:proton antiporter [Aestuariivirga sp.]|uniref:sodium:proton antiporter n=1 Tax=Aestuariivirga sp. TaxID=2650926 RepID=UPI00391C6E61
MNPLRLLAGSLLLCLIPAPAWAAEGLDGRSLGLLWAVPFIGMLLSIAVFPLLAHHFWEHHRGKVAGFWALAALVPIALASGAGTASEAVVHTALLEYIPFILLLLALFTVAGGIVIRGNLHGSPATNTALLAIGAGMASVIGTTGAAMIMIRPVIRANDDRKHNVHVVVFFIFLVANAGGALTPLGDPPLFLGFLRGVDFFWPTVHLLLPTLLIVGVLLLGFFLLDSWIYGKEGHGTRDPTPDRAVSVTGGVNFLLIPAIIGVILLSASLDLGRVTIHGTEVAIASLARDLAFIVIVVLSLAFTQSGNREENSFSWEPIREVAELFAGIFITIIPVLAMLKAGTEGAFAPLVQLVAGPSGAPDNLAYFWITGGLSSFLDNAPTYLVFFELAGGDPQQLMTEGAVTLAAISAGAVFMGANTYIGNAPNFMVYAIARDAGVKMPGFFGYMLWSGAILLPLFAVVSWLFFAG